MTWVEVINLAVLGAVFALICISLISRLLHTLGVIDLDRIRWQRVGKRLGLQYIGKDQKGVIHIEGFYRGRPIHLYRTNPVMRWIFHYAPPSYRIEIAMQHVLSEFEHRPQPFRDGFVPARAIYDFVHRLKRESPILAQLAMRYSNIMDSLLELRSYQLLSLKKTHLIYLNAFGYKSSVQLSEIKTELDRLSDFADALEKPTRHD